MLKGKVIMLKIKRILIYAIMVLAIVGFSSFNAFAGEWKYNIQYQRDNGSYMKNQWLYDNGQWYYFNTNSLLTIASWIELNNQY